MEFHPIANIFPLLQGDDFEDFRRNIAVNGLLEPIWLHPDDNSIVDGRNRFRACQELGIKPKVRYWDGVGSLVDFVMSLNLHRRHLTSSQRAALAVEILPLLEAENAKIYQDTVGRPNKSGQFFDPIPNDKNAKKSTDKAAKAMNTNRQYVSDAKRIKQDDPDLFEQITAGDISLMRAKAKKTDDVNRINSRSNNVWHTPKKYIDSARKVMGEIDLDPASDNVANDTIGAEKYFSDGEDGLSLPWFGRVWLNPPYGKLTSEFVAKLNIHIEKGDISEAILLINSNTTDTKWFQPLWGHLLCFTDHRINFYSPDNPNASGSTHGSVFVYFGINVDAFIEEFSKHGAVVKRCHG
jgi:hypothetical protein